MNLIKSVNSTAVIVRTPIELEKYEPMNSTPVKKDNKIDIFNAYILAETDSKKKEKNYINGKAFYYYNDYQLISQSCFSQFYKSFGKDYQNNKKFKILILLLEFGRS